MAVEIVKDIQKATWATCSYSFGEYDDIFGEAGKATITANIAETIGITVKYPKHTSRPIFEQSFSVSDDYDKIVHKIFPQTIGFLEKVTNRKVAIKILYEALSVEDDLLKSVMLAPFEERLSLNDAIIRACEGVLSDLHIVNTPMDFEQFVESAKTPALYNPFIDFKVGEYEYKDAIVKVRLSTTTQETYPSLVNCTMHVDIPDTDDRGIVEITDTTQPTKVYFNKFYYNPPEVVVILRGGNSADGVITPNIVSTDLSDGNGRYFEVELYDTYGTRKTGTLSWVSKGY